MNIANSIMFSPGTEVHIMRGDNPDVRLLSVAERLVIISYDDYGIIVRATDGPAIGRKFYISRSTPIIMMEVD